MRELFKILLNACLGVSLTFPVQAKVTGVVKKEALLAQLRLVLEINPSEFNPPLDLVAKLPLKNDFEELSPVFLNSWTQISYLVCEQSLNSKIWSLSESLEATTQKWLESLMLNLVGKKIPTSNRDSVLNKFIQSYPQIEAGEDNIELSKYPEFVRALSKICTIQLTRPEVYLISI